MTLPIKPLYEVVSTDYAFALIEKLDGSVKQALRRAFEKKLAVSPEGYGTNLRAPLAGYWKHEFFDHRVVYRVYNDLHLVVVCSVGPRKSGDAEDVYNQLAPLIEAGRLAAQITATLNKRAKAKVKTDKKKKAHRIVRSSEEVIQVN